VRWEANRAYSERLRAWRQRRRAWSAARVVARAWGEDTPSEPKSSGGDDEDGEEGEVTPPTHSPLPEDLPSIGYIFIQKAGITIGARQLKPPQMETEPSTGPPPQPCLALVSPDLQGSSVVLVVTETTHLVFCSSCRPRRPLESPRP
jgi:hypothetical protein